MIRFIYTVLLILLSPFFLYSLYKKKEGKPTFGPRWKEHFGFTPPLNLPLGEKSIWIHTVSVGEVIGATPFIRVLKQQNPQQIIVLTTTTATGAQQAEKLKGLVEHRFMPLDFSGAVKRFIKAVQPQKMIIMETELWPNTLATVHENDIEIIVMNARLSERSARRYAKFQSVFNLLSSSLDKVICQYKEDAERFIRLGVLEEKVVISGSIKFDIHIENEIKTQAAYLRNQLQVTKGSKHDHQPLIWIAASTHQGEDEQVLEAHQQLLSSFPNAILILVPRHPERFNQVADLIEARNFYFSRRSTQSELVGNTQVYLADTMGEMLLLLAASHVCFMGGSLLGDKVGGHNLLEPAALGIPSITGPSYYNFKEITQQLLQAEATTVCVNANQLAEQLISLFSNPGGRYDKGQQALNVIKANTGAISRTLSAINSVKAK
ncbi:lipid IV(A) 3-deoxy-D-manno-octulosonic acid transferase [Vibrio algicola]|uniref:3-deoxy-D-manno-octulosonic acid transferase n=1 Tax=Vibrio algicola TaxID=2662262 RepID=A0A5Q0TDK1_9VIBR|nr:lipid IV(A) 3-deoxy-D-manno-octulosonic acid transferase [Vibrio algicola]